MWLRSGSVGVETGTVSLQLGPTVLFSLNPPKNLCPERSHNNFTFAICDNLIPSPSLSPFLEFGIHNNPNESSEYGLLPALICQHISKANWIETKLNYGMCCVSNEKPEGLNEMKLFQIHDITRLFRERQMKAITINAFLSSKLMAAVNLRN